MRKLDLILENIRDEFMINLLEEGEVNELETLKTKKFLNENLNRIRGMLVEEGALDAVKEHLANNWGKYLAGAGALGAGYGLNEYLNTDDGQAVLSGAKNIVNAPDTDALTKMQALGSYGSGLVGNAIGDAGEAIGGAANQAGEAIGDAAKQAGLWVDQTTGTIKDSAGNIIGSIKDLIAGGGENNATAQ